MLAPYQILGINYKLFKFKAAMVYKNYINSKLIPCQTRGNARAYWLVINIFQLYLNTKHKE